VEVAINRLAHCILERERVRADGSYYHPSTFSSNLTHQKIGVSNQICETSLHATGQVRGRNRIEDRLEGYDGYGKVHFHRTALRREWSVQSSPLPAMCLMMMSYLTQILLSLIHHWQPASLSPPLTLPAACHHNLTIATAR
jgi:hypothetical protein